MAIVPRYQPGQVNERPLFQQRLTVQASAEDMGAGVGRGLGQLAQGVGQVADAMVQIKDLEDTARAKEADSAFAAWVREAQYGEGGYLTLEGRAAVEAREAFERRVAEKRQEFGAALPAGASAKYTRASETRVNSILDQSIVHAANQRKTWFKQASTDRIDTFAEDALAGYQNPALVTRNIAAGQAELRQMAELQGWDADTLKNREAEFISGVHKNIALRIAQNDPLAADGYRKENYEALSGSHRFELEDALGTAILGARADQNVSSIIGGVAPDRYDRPIDAPYRIPAGRDGTVSFEAVVAATAGLNENRDAAVISDFIKRATGTSIDPRVTPWCAAFVNSVLGAQGIEGTGSLAARSFLNFGRATDAPKPGDIVVLSRGSDPNAGHVGFFRGYDANGNILVYGGNQSDGVNVQAYSSERLLGFRTAGDVTAQTVQLPNFSPSGLAAMHDRIMQIADPREREMTRKRLDEYMTMRTKAIEAEADQAVVSIATAVAQDPTIDLLRLPPEVQSALGPAKMSELMTYQSKVRDYGQPTTDESKLFDLQTMYADDPVAFGQMSEQKLFSYRPYLSNSDWEKVTGWRQTARTDQRTAREEGLALTSAFSQATTALEALGITTTGQQGDARNAAAARVAQFQNSLAQEMAAFKAANNGRNPNQMDIQSMINRLLLPVVIEEPGGGFFGGTRTTEVPMFEAGAIGAMPGGMSASIDMDYAAIPPAERIEIEIALENQYGRRPTEDEVERAYAAYLTSQMVAPPSPFAGLAPSPIERTVLPPPGQAQTDAFVGNIRNVLDRTGGAAAAPQTTVRPSGNPMTDFQENFGQ